MLPDYCDYINSYVTKTQNKTQVVINIAPPSQICNMLHTTRPNELHCIYRMTSP